MMQKQPKRYRHLVWVVLTFQVVWSSVYAVSCFYPLDFYANRSIALGMVLLVTLAGLVMSYLQLIGIWLVFGPGRYLHRILFTVLACLAGMGVMWVAMHLSNLDDYNNSALTPAVNGLFKDVVLLFPFFFLLLQLPSALVRFIFGWQIKWGDTPPQKRPLAISDLLVITTLIAAAVASGSWINFDDLESINSVMAIGIFWLPVLILFVLPTVYFTMTPWSGTLGIPEWKGTVLVLYICLVLLSLLILSVVFMGAGDSNYVPCLVFTFVLSLWLSLWVSRRTGFRLWTGWSKRAFRLANGETDGGQAAEPVAVVDPLE